MLSTPTLSYDLNTSKGDEPYLRKHFQTLTYNNSYILITQARKVKQKEKQRQGGITLYNAIMVSRVLRGNHQHTHHATDSTCATVDNTVLLNLENDLQYQFRNYL